MGKVLGFTPLVNPTVFGLEPQVWWGEPGNCVIRRLTVNTSGAPAVVTVAGRPAGEQWTQVW